MTIALDRFEEVKEEAKQLGVLLDKDVLTALKAKNLQVYGE